jgi:protocatechuate 3,4-dioxygenase beta subunit
VREQLERWNHLTQPAARYNAPPSSKDVTMPLARPSRRELLEKAVALGTVTLAAGLTPSAVVHALDPRPRPRTPENALGPFYKKDAPATRTLRIAGEPGLPLAVSGAVLSTNGEALPEGTVEIWHTDHQGLYDIDGYRHRARLRAGADGAYAFDSIVPGHYPDRVCQHVHYLVMAPGHRPLVTQLYFATDPVFEGDPDKNFGRDPLIVSRELVRPVLLAGDPGDVRAVVTLDLVLERL